MSKQINAYHITTTGSQLLDINASSLDELTKQLSSGFYTTFRTYENRKCVLGLKAHLNRLYQPAAANEIIPAILSDAIRRELARLLVKYQGEVRVRLILTKKGEVYVVLARLKMLPPEIYQLGVRVITTDVHRESPRIKSTLFISASEEMRSQIANTDVFEALLVRNKVVLEGMTSNFFYVQEGILGTAQRDILLGVTRRIVLRVARGRGLEIKYRPLELKQLPVLSEAFLTSSSRGIVPVVSINGQSVGEGVPGPITKTLINAYDAYVRKHAEIIFTGKES